MEIIRKLFVNRPDLYYQQNNGGSYKLMEAPVTDDLIEQHLKGYITIGVPAISTSNECRWICIDSDKDDGQLQIAINESISLNLIGYREGRRPQRDGHYWIFFAKPLNSSVAYHLARWICRSVRLEENPKQERLTSGPGNCLRLPMGFNRKPLAPWERSVFEIDGSNSQGLDEQLAWLSAGLVLNRLEVTGEFMAHITPPAKPSRPHIPVGEFVDSIMNLATSDWPGILNGSQWQGRCPHCWQNGWDRTGNNLGINTATGVFNCLRGCRPRQVWQAYLLYRQQEAA